jgi:mycothione reductase
MSIHHYDLVIVGAGSGNMVVTEELSGWRIAVVDGSRFGGTCLNRGCIPSKMFVHTADIAQTINHAGRFGLLTGRAEVDWPAIRNRVFGRIDPLHDEAVAYRRAHGVDVYLDKARFVEHKVLKVGTDELHAERFVLAAGSRPNLPTIDGLEDVDFLTSDTVMRLDVLPSSMAVIGGGFIAAEMSHVFGSLGTKVTILERGPHLLAHHDSDIRDRFTDLYNARFDLRLNSSIDRVEEGAGNVFIRLATPFGQESVEVDVVLVATGRTPNSDILDVAATGVEVDEHGHVRTDDSYQTSVPGIWALGDLANHFQLKHIANAEARLVAHNLAHPDDIHRSTFPVVPSAVFADPQVASVGATEQDLLREGRPYLTATRPYSDAAYGWALEDTTGFVKVLADPATRLLLGAHLLGPQASTLIQPLLQAMCLGNTVDQVATDVIYIHPALSEVVEQTLLAL